MWRTREFVPEGIKNYVRLMACKLSHPDSYIGSPLVGRRVRMGRGCSVSRGAEVSDGVQLGDFSYVNCGAIVASGEFGRFCSVGPYAVIGMPNHPTDFLSTSPRLYGRKNVFGAPSQWTDISHPPQIGSDVWIGAFAFVRQGVRIGHGAIVGAGAVVTHDVPPYAIVAGVPARLIRSRFSPPIVAELLETRWWERSEHELSRDPSRFQHAWRGFTACEETR